MLKQKFKIFCSLAILCLLPDVSWAAASAAEVSSSGSVFDIISNKMIQTVMDVREIVYVIAGFGLIMFAVLAVFNKISFKHLAYICIGLFLLAVMMPFINYFSGANLVDPKLNYGNLIDPENASVVGSDVSSGGTSNQWGAAFGDQAGLPNIPGITDEASGLNSALGQLTGDENTIGDDEPCEGTKITTKNGKTKCCKNGLNKKGTGCKTTLGDIVNGAEKAVDTGKSAIEAGRDALAAADRAKRTIEGVVDGVQAAGDILKNGEGGLLGALDTVGKLGDSIQQTADTVGSNFNLGLEDTVGAMDAASHVGKNIGGEDNSFSNTMDDNSYRDFVDKAKSKTQNDRGTIQDVGQVGEDLGRMGDDITGLQNQMDGLGDWFNK